MKRTCNCSGACGPHDDGLTRRDFIELVGAGAASVLLSNPASGASEMPAAELDRWQRELFDHAPRRRYHSGTHTDARMHLGGIGTGNIEIGVDGQFTTWQLFNTLRDGRVPLYFAVKAGKETKLLQTAGGPDWPRIKEIVMQGEYPVATLQFGDPELPVELELTAFSPFVPLDTALSSQPLAVFLFRVHNPTARSQTVSLAAFMQNPVGYDAAGDREGVTHPNYGANVNEFFKEGRARGLFMRAEAGEEPTLDQPVSVYTLTNLSGLNAPPPDRPKELKVVILDGQALFAAELSDLAHTVIWLEEPRADLSASFLRAVRDAVQAGATLVFCGKAMPLLQVYASTTGGRPLPQVQSRPDVRFEDFDRGYGNWKVQGEAFGKEPAHGTLANQQPVSGFLGRGLVNTYLGGDDTAGKLISANYALSGGQSSRSPGFGTVALATLAHSVTARTALDDWNDAWRQFAELGHFAAPAASNPNAPTPPGRSVNGALAATVRVPAGASVEVPFLVAWHYPNKYNAAGVWMGCHYATLWSDARAVIRDAAVGLATLREQTERFRGTFYDSTLPYWLLDSVTANAAIIRHIGVVFRIANGDIYGWEGSNGCCQPTCTHVWGYEQTLARLFPDLEKAMRHIDFKHQQREDGGVNNRTEVPSPPHPTGEQPFADGHASCILKAYREALNHPDESFFQEYWLHLKRGVEYLIARDAKTSGGQPGGILQDDQWNTYDEALHGVTTFISGYYLAALRAGEEWARRLGDPATADRFHGIFEKGRDKLVELCWNGEYFQQHLPDYLSRPGEVGPGCMADQLIGQWWAHQLGLGYLLPKEMVQSALSSIYRYNFKSDLTGWKHAPRAFAGAKDKGLIICTWPKGGRPAHVMLYSDEVWTGIEYQVAAHLIYEGLIEEGFAIVKAARDRYDGIPRPPIPRNPWNEIECGGHYARAMSSWSLLLALSGYEYDGPGRILRVGPRHTPADFRCFFCAPEGWGSLAQKAATGMQRVEVTVQYGALRLQTLMVALVGNLKPAKTAVTAAGKIVPATFEVSEGRAIIQLAMETVVKAGETIAVLLT